MRTEITQQRFPIWAVGGGKGGTGKTFVSAALGAQLSRQGVGVNLIDADFGAPNLHTFLGVQEPNPTLEDFFFEKQDLENVLLETELVNLKLAAGPRRHLNMPSLEYFRKMRFLRQIKEVAERRLTIVDTGAGTALNTLDFFAIAREAILVVNPNPASVENMFLFLEAVVLRILRLVSRKLGIESELKQSRSARELRSETVPDLLRLAGRLGDRYEDRLRGALEQFQPCLVINQSEQHSDLLLGRGLVDVAKRCLQIKMHYLGAVPYDPAVRQSLRKIRPFVSCHSDSDTATAILLIMDRLLERSHHLGTKV